MEHTETIEIFVDGKLKKSVKTFKALETFIYKYHDKEGYEEIMSSHGGNCGFYIFLDNKNMSSVCISWRTFTGFYDKHKKKIYLNDVLKDENGNHMHLDYANKETVNSWYFSQNQPKIGWYIVIENYSPGGKNTYHYIESEKETKKLEIYKTY